MCSRIKSSELTVFDQGLPKANFIFYCCSASTGLLAVGAAAFVLLAIGQLIRSKESASAGVATHCMKLAEHAIDEDGSGSWRMGVLVFEIERLPFEGAELMEGLHLDPLDISHASIGNPSYSESPQAARRTGQAGAARGRLTACEFRLAHPLGCSSEIKTL